MQVFGFLHRKPNAKQIAFHLDNFPEEGWDILEGHKHFAVKGLISNGEETLAFLFDMDTKETMIYSEKQWYYILQIFDVEWPGPKYETSA